MSHYRRASIEGGLFFFTITLALWQLRFATKPILCGTSITFTTIP
ncbi:MAG TPA: hypothetical protein VH684_10380 [Xanthobacteraceae bacterium]